MLYSVNRLPAPGQMRAYGWRAIRRSRGSASARAVSAARSAGHERLRRSRPLASAKCVHDSPSSCARRFIRCTQARSEPAPPIASATAASLPDAIISPCSRTSARTRRPGFRPPMCVTDTFSAALRDAHAVVAAEALDREQAGHELREARDRAHAGRAAAPQHPPAVEIERDARRRARGAGTGTAAATAASGRRAPRPADRAAARPRAAPAGARRPASSAARTAARGAAARGVASSPQQDDGAARRAPASTSTSDEQPCRSRAAPAASPARRQHHTPGLGTRPPAAGPPRVRARRARPARRRRAPARPWRPPWPTPHRTPPATCPPRSAGARA